MKLGGWWDKLEAKAQAKAEKAELAKQMQKDWEAELPQFGKMMKDSLQVKLHEKGLNHSAFKKMMEEQALYGSSVNKIYWSNDNSSASSGETAYFDQPSSWKPLPWQDHVAVWSASAYQIGTNYTQIHSSPWVTAQPPMTIERAIALNDGKS